ncbi:MAG: AAA family ATPase, partial [Planctomycetota bacterium]|nr:AAA family ATPase [Planctomycetota bacterium]
MKDDAQVSDASPVSPGTSGGPEAPANDLDGIQAIAALGRPIDVRVEALTLDNFKSFAKKTRIPIRDGFTTVSGPNGSGKSNIIDAIQFVLGIATSKGMRAERLTDLICIEGTKPSARVTLELAGAFEDADGRRTHKKVEVTRVVRRQKSGAQAHYEVDGTPVRLTDLHDLMRDLGFPTSGQNIVLQGDVIRLTSMGGVARRQVLDELAGAREFALRST